MDPEIAADMLTLPCLLADVATSQDIDRQMRSFVLQGDSLL